VRSVARKGSIDVGVPGFDKDIKTNGGVARAIEREGLRGAVPAS